MTRLPQPDLVTDEGTLRSLAFDDIYYSPDDGLAETDHVFIAGNELPQRLRASRAARPFVIGELGFGTGLNVLAACRCHQKFGRGPLDIWTVEGFPLSRSSFAKIQYGIAARWPELAPWAERLAAAYPEPVPGQTQVRLGDGVTLTIAFGNVLPSLKAARFTADAWFLDGFAPSRNPAMWSDDVMGEIARLTAPSGTAATFSVASGVRGALESAGFSWEKTPGFGRKKHMLRAVLKVSPATADAAPWYANPSPSPVDNVAIIGAGIAGGSVAQALSDRGFRSTVFGAGSRGQAASSNPAGLVMPRLDADDTPAARFYRDAFLYALSVYNTLDADAFSACGGALAMDAARFDRLTTIALWPDDLLSFGDAQAHVKGAGVLNPRAAIDTMLQDAVLVDGEAATPEQDGDHWFVTTADDNKRRGPFGAVVLATGAMNAAWSGAPIIPSLGQLDIFSGKPPVSVTTDGHYIAPYNDHILTGATYARYDGGDVATSQGSTQTNRQAAATLLGRDPGEHVTARAALRATTPDRHPIAGPLYDRHQAIEAYAGLRTGLKRDYPPAPYRVGLYALTGLGSRGLVTAPILGAHIAALIAGGVSPLASDIAAMTHPGRFLIRDLKRGKISP